nr:MAG TPA: hypothetical protein [Caudoviricetes sp.]
MLSPTDVKLFGNREINGTFEGNVVRRSSNENGCGICVLADQQKPDGFGCSGC